MKYGYWLAVVATACCFTESDTAEAVKAQPSLTLPTPRLAFHGTEAYEANGFDFVRYQYDVTNKSKYPKALFAVSPDLPPCGQNASPTRIAVGIYTLKGKQITEFCSLPGPEYLGRLWFGVLKGTFPPSGVYVQITDRLTGKSARSNVAPCPKPTTTKE